MNQFELRKAVDQILWNDWDPKGLKGQEGAYDAYYSFINPIVGLLNEGKGLQELAQLLHHFAFDEMTLLSKPEDHLEVAKQLVDLLR